MIKPKFYAIICAALGGYITGWHISNYGWTNKRMQEGLDEIFTMAHLNSDIVNWTLDRLDMVKENPDEFVEGFIEQVQFVTIAADTIYDEEV